MKTLRLFALLDHLRTCAGPVSSEALAQVMNVSARTIYRDMVTLQAMGAPVRGEAGIGYQLEKGYFLPPLHFGPDELDAIMLGMRLIAAKGDDQLMQAAKCVSGKVSAVMNAASGATYKDLPLRAVSRKTDEGEKAKLYLSALRLAIREKKVLDLNYLDLQDNQSHRRIRPLGLTLFDHVWLLTVWCESRNAFRNLRLDRIIAIHETDQRFRHENGKRFTDYLASLEPKS
jgi:predicted DNA-binding transcriptional regulator YafY